MKELINKLKEVKDLQGLIDLITGSEVIRYLFIGVCTTLVNMAVFAFLCEIVHLEANTANVISIICAIAFAYAANKIVVFRTHCDSLGEMVLEAGKFVGGRLVTMGIEIGGFYLVYNILHQHEMVAKISTQFLVIVGNYFISKFLVFRKK